MVSWFKSVFYSCFDYISIRGQNSKVSSLLPKIQTRDDKDRKLEINKTWNNIAFFSILMLT